MYDYEGTYLSKHLDFIIFNLMVQITKKLLMNKVVKTKVVQVKAV